MIKRYKAYLYRDTMFGSYENVLNIPSQDYDFTQHTTKTYDNVVIRTPLLMNELVLRGEYSIDLDRFDYMRLYSYDNDNPTVEEYLASYFINSIVGDNVNIAVSLALDVISTNKITTKQVTGVIVRKHDVNPNEKPYDYPTALQNEGVMYNSQAFDVVSYDDEQVRIIESAVDLSEVAPSQVINSGSELSNIVIPVLPKPTHTTVYGIEAFQNTHYDRTGAFTLYDADLIDNHVLNTVRGLSGDGSISDSYSIPSEAVDIVRQDSGITSIIGKNLFKSTRIKPEEYIENFVAPYTIKNPALLGNYKILIQSTVTKDSAEYEGWNIKDSIASSGELQVNLWCDPKPSGNPFCAPTQVESIIPLSIAKPNDLTTQDYKSVKGKQWVRNPLIYSTAQGSKFSEIEAELSRRQAKNEYNNALVGLNIGERERNIQLAQAEFATDASNISEGANLIASVATKNVGGALNSAGNLITNNVNAGFASQIAQLRDYEFNKQKEMLGVSLKGNLNNINIGLAISRTVPVQITNTESDSLSSYEQFNAFSILLTIPDKQSIIAKDIEYSVYGYPVFEFVNDFIIEDNLRQNHTVYQFENPIIDLGGVLGEYARNVLQSGIRVLSKPYSKNNLLNNPKG